MKKSIILSILAILALSACQEKAPQIVSGREWNSGRNLVADTTSSFLHWDPFIVQLE